MRIILLLGLATLAAQARGELYFYHPAVAGAYAQALEEIREGIEARTRAPVQSLAYLSAHEDAAVTGALARLKAEDTIVAIGDEALKSLRQLGVAARIIAGAVALSPASHSTISGISIYAAPARYFAALSRLLPDTVRVHFVHRAELPSDFVAHVARQAERAGLVLEPHAVAGLRDTAVIVNRLLARSPSDQAIWLHRGVLEFNSELLLGPILERSWS